MKIFYREVFATFPKNLIGNLTLIPLLGLERNETVLSAFFCMKFIIALFVSFVDFIIIKSTKLTKGAMIDFIQKNAQARPFHFSPDLTKESMLGFQLYNGCCVVQLSFGNFEVEWIVHCFKDVLMSSQFG